MSAIAMRCEPGGRGSGHFDCCARWRSLHADRAGRPPTLSSLADEWRVASLLLSTAARDPKLIAPLAGARSTRIALIGR
jgi:hypothetical protein